MGIKNKKKPTPTELCTCGERVSVYELLKHMLSEECKLQSWRRECRENGWVEPASELTHLFAQASVPTQKNGYYTLVPVWAVVAAQTISFGFFPHDNEQEREARLRLRLQMLVGDVEEQVVLLMDYLMNKRIQNRLKWGSTDWSVDAVKHLGYLRDTHADRQEQRTLREGL